MNNEHEDAVNGLAKKVSDTLPDAADGKIASNAIKTGAEYLPTDELKQLAAAITGEDAALRILQKVGGASITGVASSDAVSPLPVFNPKFAVAHDDREALAFKASSKAPATNS